MRSSSKLRKNWLVALLTSIYVEIFRNIPLLLWILLIFVPLYEMTPAPNAFKVTDEMIAAGTEPAASMILGGTVAITNRGTYIPGFLFDRGFESIEELKGRCKADTGLEPPQQPRFSDRALKGRRVKAA
jgi:general L-amino acid transport system permease protein